MNAAPTRLQSTSSSSAKSSLQRYAARNQPGLMR